MVSGPDEARNARQVSFLHAYKFLIRVKQFAREVGFDLCGIGSCARVPRNGIVPCMDRRRTPREMRYLESRDDAGELKRSSLSRVAPWARSVDRVRRQLQHRASYSTQADDPSVAGSPAMPGVTRTIMTAPLSVCVSRGGDPKRFSGSPISSPGSFFPFLRRHRPVIERIYAKYAAWDGLPRIPCIINQKLGSVAFSRSDPDLALTGSRGPARTAAEVARAAIDAVTVVARAKRDAEVVASACNFRSGPERKIGFQFDRGQDHSEKKPRPSFWLMSRYSWQSSHARVFCVDAFDERPVVDVGTERMIRGC